MHQRDGISILHVDDEPDLSETVAAFLEREDERFTVEVATNAREGLKRLSRADFDCIVSDLDMPGRNGIEFLEAVREQDPDVPFILYTGKGSEEIASEAISAGVTDYIQKRTGTAQYEVLANRIVNAVEKHRSTERAEAMDRIRRILREVDKRLVRAQTREEIESAVCHVLAETGSYPLAWVGDEEGGAVRRRASAGTATDFLEVLLPHSDERPLLEGPTRRALRTGERAVVQSIAEGQRGGSWETAAVDHGLRSAAAVPLAYDDRRYGAVALYSDEQGFFDERERELLVELGEDIAHAIHRVESERRLREQQSDLRVYERAVESSADLLAGIDTGYTLVFANERYREFHGISPEEIGERSLPDVLGEKWDEGVKRREDRVLEGEEIRYEVERVGPDGETRTFSVRDYPLLDEDGTVLGVVGSMRDITERKDKERELRRLKERLDLAVEAAEIGVWDWNVRTDEMQFNEQWADMLGCSLSEIDSHLDAWTRRVHPDDFERAQAELEAHLAGDTAYYECEHRMRTADGSWKWIQNIGRVTERTADGEPVRAVGIHLDIDERKQRERALQESKRRYDSLFESNPAVIWEVDFSDVIDELASLRSEVIDFETHLEANPVERQRLLDRTEVIDVSQQAVDRYGVPSTEPLIANPEEIFTPAAYEATVEIWRRLADGETQFRVPSASETVDGQRIEEIIDVQVPDAYADDYSRVYVTAIDITDRCRRERKVTALHDVAVDLETRGSVEYVCERTIDASRDILEFDLSLIDLEADGVLSTVALSEDVSPDETARMSIEEGIAGKTYRTGESIVIDDINNHEEAKPQGPFRSGMSIPIGDHGVFQVVAEEPGSFDESDLELAELLISHTESALDRLDRQRELERKNERIEEFTRVVSHDLRNPLQVARSQLELLQTAHDHDFEEIDAAMRAHERIETLIDDLLALARDGERDISLEEVELDDAAERCWGTVETADASLDIRTDRTIPADRGQLRHLLENLFHNAAEHGGDVTVTVGDLEDGFYVEDDGPGIPIEDRPDIFETGYSTATGGGGLGLAIVKRVVDAHGWEIDVTSGAAGGARFEITGEGLHGTDGP
ncbi:MAG: GAF domain-containing protein [Halapricum sp.]